MYVAQIITLFQLSFHGPSEYNSEMLEKLRLETYIHTELTVSHCHILRAHIAK